MIRLAPQAGKMEQILCSDWLPEWARWAYLARSGLQISFGNIINPLLASFFFCVFIDLDFVQRKEQAWSNNGRILTYLCAKAALKCFSMYVVSTS